jgi:hypothetical protein
MKFKPYTIYRWEISPNKGYLIMGKRCRGIFVYRNEGTAPNGERYQYITFKEIYTYKMGKVGLRSSPLSAGEAKKKRKFNQCGIEPAMEEAFKQACDYVKLEYKGVVPDLDKPVDVQVKEVTAKQDEISSMIKGRVV